MHFCKPLSWLFKNFCARRKKLPALSFFVEFSLVTYYGPEKERREETTADGKENCL